MKVYVSKLVAPTEVILKIYIRDSIKVMPYFFLRNCSYYYNEIYIYRGADKSLARPTSLCILFDGDNIPFDASLVLYIYIYK
jgi:hypothetical protein